MDNFVEEQRVDQVRIGRLGDLRVVIGADDGDPTAHLMFRTGMADETLTTRGYTHLAEHLSLTSLLTTTLSMNGYTGLSETGMFAHASISRLAEFVNHVITMINEIGDPSSSVIGDDVIRQAASVLEAEAQTANASIVSELLAQLYGASRLGLGAYPEHGLKNLDVAAFREFAAERLVASNAVLLLSHKVPGITAALPTGSPAPAVDGSVIADNGGFVRRRAPFCAVGSVERSSSASLFASLLARRLVTDLREDAAISYSPSAGYNPVNANEAFIAVLADVSEGNESEVANAALQALDDIAKDGAPQAAIDEMVDSYEETRETSGFRLANAHRLASALLFGDDLRGVDDTLTLMNEVTPASIAEVASQFLDEAAFSLPTDANLTVRPIRPYADAPDPIIDGPRFSSTEHPETNWIQASSAGLTSNAGTNRFSIDADEIAGVFRWRDGARQVVDERGVGITLIPGVWEDEVQLRQTIDDLVPAKKTVHAGFRHLVRNSDPPIAKRFVPRHWWPVFPAVGIPLLIACSWISPELVGLIVPLLALVVSGWANTRRALAEHYALYDTWGDRAREGIWQRDWPRSAAYGPGALHLAWLIDRCLLSEWFRAEAHSELSAYEAGELSPIELYQAVDGMLESSMVTQPAANSFLSWHFGFVPETADAPSFERWREAIGNKGQIKDDPETVRRSHEFLDLEVQRGFRLYSPLTRLSLKARDSDAVGDNLSARTRS